MEVDFGASTANKRIRDESLNILDGLVEVVRELRLDSQPVTDNATRTLATLQRAADFVAGRHRRFGRRAVAQCRISRICPRST